MSATVNSKFDHVVHLSGLWVVKATGSSAGARPGWRSLQAACCWTR